MFRRSLSLMAFDKKKFATNHFKKMFYLSWKQKVYISDRNYSILIPF